MSKQTGYARNIIFSIIFSIRILLTLGFLSIKYLVPIYDLKSQDIYQFLIYLLPILIGLALIEIGSLIASKREDEEYDDDLLPKNCYDAPLFDRINDDPLDIADYSSFTTATPPITFRDTLDKDLAKRFEKYNNFEVIKIIDEYESSLYSNKVESPFDEVLTSSLFNLSENDAKRALSWIQSGSPLPIENSVVLENLNYETVQEIKKLSQREALQALEFISRNTSFASLDHLDETTLLSLSLLDNETVTNAIKWIHLGSPKAEDPNARVFHNLDADTQLRLEEYNSIQVNVGLDYIDEGAPDVKDANSIVLPNVDAETVDRLLTLTDEEINKGLDALEFTNLDNLNSDTLDRLSNYNDEDIHKALDSLESVNLYNFNEETLNRLNTYSIDQVNSGLDFIDEGSPEVEVPASVVLPNLNVETIDRLLDFTDEDINKSLDALNLTNIENLSEDTINRLSSYSDGEINKGLDSLDSPTVYSINDETKIRLNCYNSEQVNTALNYIDDGAPEALVPSSVVLPNVNPETVHRLLDFNDEEINKGLDSLDSPTVDSLNDETKIRLNCYNAEQVNTALNYIDDGAPKVEVPASVVLPNVNSETVDRLLDFSDEEINKGLDSLEFDTLDSLSCDTLDRLSKYTEDDINTSLDTLELASLYNLNKDTLQRLKAYSEYQIHSGLDYIDKGQPVIKEGLPFDEEINSAIKNFSSSEALKAVNYIKNIHLFDTSLGDLSNNLEDFLDSELNDNIQQGFNYDLSIAIFDKENILSGDVKDILLSKLPTYTYTFETENGHTAIIFPYEGKEKAKKCIDDILSEEANLFDNKEVRVGYAGQENRQLDARTLINEAYLN